MNANAQLIEARAMLVHLKAITRRVDGSYPADVRDLEWFLNSAAVASQVGK